MTLEGFLGANRNWYIDNITDVSFRINVIDASNGALAQASKAATFHWSVPVKH